MPASLLALLALFTCLGAGLVGGVFLAFSSFVMKALSQLPAPQGVAAMQRINVVVINPVFIGLFMGTALLALACAVVAFFPWQPARSPWWLAAGLFYLVGCLGVTGACNVPMNERLAHLGGETREAADHWPTYVRRWTMWNHLRCAASTAAAACAAIVLLV